MVHPIDPLQGGAPLLVMKFGGSSLAGAEHLRRVAGIVRQHLHLRPVVVVSAMGKTTNELLAAAERALRTGTVEVAGIRATHEGVLGELGVPVPASVNELLHDLERVLSGVSLLREVSARTRDLVASFGERLSVRVFAAFFNHERVNGAATSAEARPLDSWQIGVLTTSGAGSASSAFSEVEVLPQTYANVQLNLAPLTRDYTYLPIVTGYIAQDEHGTITTLGRDGSDLTATVIGAAVHASEVQIWKDVDGVLTADPRLVPAARPVGVLTFEEAAELFTFGSKVVHPAAVMPAWLAKLPINVRNSMVPEQPGTRIVADLGPDDNRQGRVTAISCKRGITVILIQSTRMLGQHGFLARVFQVFDKLEVSVDVIATSEVTVSLTLDQGYKAVDLVELRAELESVAKVEIREGMSMITLITSKHSSCVVLRQAFEVFETSGVVVEMVSHGASNVNVTFVLPDRDLAPCTSKLHEVFFESSAAAGRP